MRVNGIAHIILTVNDPARSVPFYERIFSFLEFTTVLKTEQGAYFVGAAVGIMPAAEEHRGATFVQARLGLHHFCLRAYSRADVDCFYQHLLEMGAKIVHPPEEGPWAPGYYSVLFEDPDGIRLELNFVPGQGLLSGDAKFNPVGYEPKP
jgi:catechol 2,3-dioxygenase-like lactoylglutathione lyase family enzyme